MDVKTFATFEAAESAIIAAEETWVRPELVEVGFGPHIDRARLEGLRLAEAVELVDGTWAVLQADHPALQGDDIDPELIHRPDEGVE